MGYSGWGCALVHFQGSYPEVDLDEMRSPNRLIDVIARDGDLRRHLHIAKFPIRDLVGSQTLIVLSEMRNGIPNRNKKTRQNTDARLNSKEFYEPGISQKISIREMGALNDSMEHLSRSEH